MKESYHICFTSHNEVMFRDEEDHGMFVNLMALRGFAEETEIIVDAAMSTHVHQNVFSANPMRYASLLRMSYTRFFNRKYDRKGRLGEKYTFLLKVVGAVHQMILENYILRQGLHHAASATALGYPYCAVRELFAKDTGLQADIPVPMSRSVMATYLPRYAEFPDEYRMTDKGVFTRSCFMEIRRAEQYYVSPRNYLYQMNRLTDESWKEEQKKDNSGKPITLGDIENADEKTVAQMLKNESGRYFKENRMQDLDVCRLVDQDLLRSYGVSSIYQLTDSQKQRLFRLLFYDYRLPDHQIRRCLALG